MHYLNPLRYIAYLMILVLSYLAKRAGANVKGYGHTFCWHQMFHHNSEVYIYKDVELTDGGWWNAIHEVQCSKCNTKHITYTYLTSGKNWGANGEGRTKESAIALAMEVTKKDIEMGAKL